MNQQDKLKLLELAALAGDIQFRGYDLWYEDFSAYDPEMDCNYRWNPLDDDGDAFRLACKLFSTVFIFTNKAIKSTGNTSEIDWSIVTANTRYEIVKAAAEIGETM